MRRRGFWKSTVSVPVAFGRFSKLSNFARSSDLRNSLNCIFSRDWRESSDALRVTSPQWSSSVPLNEAATPAPRHGLARPDHRSRHTRSHRCGFADGSSRTMTGSRTVPFSDAATPAPRHGLARPDHRSPRTRSYRCGFADGSVEPNHDGFANGAIQRCGYARPASWSGSTGPSFSPYSLSPVWLRRWIGRAEP